MFWALFHCKCHIFLSTSIPSFQEKKTICWGLHLTDVIPILNSVINSNCFHEKIHKIIIASKLSIIFSLPTFKMVYEHACLWERINDAKQKKKTKASMFDRYSWTRLIRSRFYLPIQSGNKIQIYADIAPFRSKTYYRIYTHQ